MYPKLADTISFIQKRNINQGRIAILRPLVEYIQQKVNAGTAINLNFICTHNSRRSHLCQVWAQIAAGYYQTGHVYCYSGGTEETALYPQIAKTLEDAGLQVKRISQGPNPVYILKYDSNALPVIGFSKKYDDLFNPTSAFAAIMTCSQADGGCPFIAGTEERIPITYEDPKISDGTALQTDVYKNRSLEIAAEMFYVFSQIK
ncbi:low molecular weight phosphatase family protein [Sphingobacterium tabacisoli]|uniref:Protein-tyrosine-phosphatase n=1 Tax=Sphingobacterium tabacisoli TaxID=2044855 RepID=A0ABW5L4K3_9SPHI|nr:protein-tyrosine-phosphatase [Sphingobacterium tabacisoli]